MDVWSTFVQTWHRPIGGLDGTEKDKFSSRHARRKRARKGRRKRRSKRKGQPSRYRGKDPDDDSFTIVRRKGNKQSLFELCHTVWSARPKEFDNSHLGPTPGQLRFLGVSVKTFFKEQRRLSNEERLRSFYGRFRVLYMRTVKQSTWLLDSWELIGGVMAPRRLPENWKSRLAQDARCVARKFGVSTSRRRRKPSAPVPRKGDRAGAAVAPESSRPVVRWRPTQLGRTHPTPVRGRLVR